MNAASLQRRPHPPAASMLLIAIGTLMLGSSAGFRYGETWNQAVAGSPNSLRLTAVRSANLRGCTGTAPGCGYGTEKNGWIPFTNQSQHYRMDVPASLWDASVQRSAPTVVYQPGDTLAYVAPAYRYLSASDLLGLSVPKGEKYVEVENESVDISTSPEYRSTLVQSLDATGGEDLVADATAFFGDCGFTTFTFVPSAQDGTYDITFVGTGLSNPGCTYVSGDPAVPKGEGVYPAVVKYSVADKKALFVAAYPGCRWTTSQAPGSSDCADAQVFKSMAFLS